MDKTISISLGGFSFIVDDRAFYKLKNYLDEIRRSLHGMEGTEDIIADVEVRIAELFKEKMGAREVVNELDVEHVIGIMGRPEQYMDTDSEEFTTHSSSQSSRTYTHAGDTVKKKLYRDPNDKIIAGVLSGLAHYIGVETWVTRLIFIALLFSDFFVSLTSITVISYIVLWIILPKAETASQKYEMYGQAGDFETIKKNVSQATAEMKGVAKDASSVLSRVISVIAKLILIFIGIILICTGISLIAGAIGAIITSSTDLPMQIFGYIVDYPWQDWASKLILFLLMGIPGVLFIVFGLRLISDRIKLNKTFVFGSIALWILAIIGGAIIVGTLFKNFTRDIEFAEKKAYTVSADTLTISFEKFHQVNNRRVKWDIDDIGGFIEFNDKLHKNIWDDIEIKTSPDNQVYVELMYYSKGKNMDDARNNAEQIQYNYQMNSKGELVFDNYLTLPKGSKFRDQKISIAVYVPKNMVIHTLNVDDIITSDLSNDRNYIDAEGKYFNYVENYWQCANCFHDDDDDDFNGVRVIKINGNDTANVKISGEGVNIEGDKGKVIIEKKKVKISDGTDSINIDISGN